MTEFHQVYASEAKLEGLEEIIEGIQEQFGFVSVAQLKKSRDVMCLMPQFSGNGVEKG